MTLYFSSGGGRFGNQILNLIHLIALSIEYDLKVIKLNDLFIVANDGSLMFDVNSDKVSWEINKNTDRFKFFYRFFYKFYILLFHIYFHFSPFKKSYKIGDVRNLPKFILGNNLNTNYYLNRLKQESYKYDIVISGWGVRDWGLVLKHKKLILENLKKGFESYISLKKSFKKDYLLVHIRRTDFLEIDTYKALNFDDQTWLKSIVKLCLFASINKVVIFSDSKIDEIFISKLKMNGLEVIIPETYKNNKDLFLKLFIRYINSSYLIICNSSTLVLSIAFLFHEIIYLPSKDKDFQKVFLNEAHENYPTNLNWN